MNTNGFYVPLDNDGFPFRFPAFELDWRESAKIRHEINTNYGKYKDRVLCQHESYGIDHTPYTYYFENRGFDNINIYSRIYNNR